MFSLARFQQALLLCCFPAPKGLFSSLASSRRELGAGLGRAAQPRASAVGWQEDAKPSPASAACAASARLGMKEKSMALAFSAWGAGGEEEDAHRSPGHPGWGGG